MWQIGDKFLQLLKLFLSLVIFKTRIPHILHSIFWLSLLVDGKMT